MSKGAIKELVRADHQKFEHLSKDIPYSEKQQIIKYLARRVIVLEGYL